MKKWRDEATGIEVCSATHPMMPNADPRARGRKPHLVKPADPKKTICNMAVVEVFAASSKSLAFGMRDICKQCQANAVKHTRRETPPPPRPRRRGKKRRARCQQEPRFVAAVVHGKRVLRARCEKCGFFRQIRAICTEDRDRLKKIWGNAHAGVSPRTRSRRSRNEDAALAARAAKTSYESGGIEDDR